MVKLTIKPEANQIIHQLQAHGFEAFAVGGCVRNALLGLCPHDWDICTNAKPEEMRAVFCDHVTHDFGLKHGTLVVMRSRMRSPPTVSTACMPTTAIPSR